MTIHFSNVSFRYSSQTEEVFSSLNWENTSAEVIGLLGENGSGKSTFLRLIGGLLSPIKGIISVNDRKISGISSINQEICYVPENAKLFLIGPTLKAELLRIGKNKTEIHSLLQSSGLESLTEKKLYLLSEGQRRLIAIWLAFQLERSIILLDEPSIGMDVQGKFLFNKLVHKAVTDGKTVIIASNDSRILPLFDRIVVFADQGIKLDGPPKEVLFQLEKLTQLLPNQVVRVISSLNNTGYEIPLFTNINQLNEFLQTFQKGAF